MGYEFITMETTGRVLKLSLNRGPANALGRAFGEELFRAFCELGHRDDVSVVIITSALEKAFIAGADIKEMAAMNQDESASFSKLLQEAFSLLPSLKKVVIAAINGHAMGGGCELALACDYRFMTRGKALIGLPEAGLGIVPGAGGTQRLSRLLGVSKALDILLRARVLGPEEALEMGLVDRLFDAETFQDDVMAFATALASGAGKALGFIKVAVQEGLELPIEKGFDVERKYGLENLRTHDAKEGLSAFAEKRKPNFTNQ
jgi:enoyl-CoA hydratase